MDTNGGTPHGRAGPSPNTAVVDAAFAELRELEHARRLADAARLRALARVLEAAVPSPVGPAGPGSAGGATAARARMIAYRSLRLELAATLSTSEHVAERLLDTAAVASEQYAAALAALEAGAISLPHVEVIVAEGGVFTTGSPERDLPLRRRYEREVLEVARQAPPQRLRPIARRIAAELAEVPLAERHREARERRHVRVTEETDGMSLLTAFLPSVDAHAIHDRLTRLVRAAEREEPNVTPRESRAARRADALCDLLLGRPGRTLTAARDIAAQVHVIVPARHLARASGAGGGIAEVLGVGPVDPDTARELAASGDVWNRVRVDNNGTVLAVDRYRPSHEMRRFLAMRDLHCRAPGCTVPAQRCDLDHTVDAARGGATSTDNLAHLCRGHHTVKHHGGWRLSQSEGGVAHWTSASGQEFREEPPSRVRFRARSERSGKPERPAKTQRASSPERSATSPPPRRAGR